MTKTSPTARATVSAGLCLLLAVSRPAEEGKAQARSDGSRELAATRWFEPRLTGSSVWQPCTTRLRQGHLVEEADCQAPHSTAQPVSRSHEDCDEVTATHRGALRALARLPRCTDAAVDRLKGLAAAGSRQDAASWNDLAAAYYVRAQRMDDPSDLPRSLDAAERAVAAAPQLLEARFNRALALEALGFSAEAQVAWDHLRRADSSRWAGEAGEHWTRLERDRALRAATSWPLNRQRLPEAVRAGDRTAVAKLIEPYPAATQQYLEEEILPDWASALSDHHPDEARRQLAIAKMISGELAHRTGDSYLSDAVAVIEKASRPREDPAALEALRKGHLAFREARREEKALGPRRAALYQQASRLLAQAGSPLRTGANLGNATALLFEPKQRAFAGRLLRDLERAACGHHYGNLCGRIQAGRAYDLFYQGHYLESLDLYDAVLDNFERMKDPENLAKARSRKSGVLRPLGQPDFAWHEVFQALRQLPYIVEVQSRHYVLGEAAAAAFALDAPNVALLYQSSAVGLITDELARTPGDQSAIIQGLRKNLAIARRARAAFELHLEQLGPARQDLDAAIRLASEDQDENIKRAILARIEEVKAQSLVDTDPRAAIAAFDETYRLSSPGEYRTFRAMLLLERAKAQRRAGYLGEAEKDLQAAIDELRAEETGLLDARQPGQDESLWTAYFSRSQEPYKLLIRQLVDEKRQVDAFNYAEKARAFEPLSLVRRLRLAPEVAARVTHTFEPFQLDQIQASLPRGTVLVEYCVLADKTLAWLVSHDRFEPLALAAGEAQIKQWTATLQRAASRRDLPPFEAGLTAPFSALLAVPLSHLGNLADGPREDRRLVLLPDGPIHGLPLAALRDPATKRFLIQELPVSVAASATLYVLSLARDKALPPARVPKVLLVGAPAVDATSELTRDLPPLAHAGTEIKGIAALYAPRPGEACTGRVKPLTGTGATVPAFLEEVRDSTVVHLAGHAIADPKAPHRSALVLARSPHQPGVLYAEELLGKLKLDRTRIVVLSACSTSGGHPVGPEGLAALVRPFIAAGAPAVVGSLWDVEDAPTEDLLVSFHRHYKEGHDAAVALRLAQLDLINNKGAGLQSVLAWAPFQVIGHASPPCSQTTPHPRRISP